MEGSAAINDLAALVDDRPGDGVFRIDRAVYTDPTVYEAELDGIFRGGWVYLCHESEIANTGDYCATHMGVDPVLVTRAKDGAVRGFINACTHRGALLTQCRRGNAGALTCRFHGWSYALDGRCLRVKNEAEGYGEAEVDRAPFDLTPIGRVESYRGFVFGSMTEEVPPLADYLGAAKAWIDLIADQSPDGLEVVPGSSTYVIWGNWKMQAENGVDGYHVSTVHRVYANTVMHREELRAGSREGMRKTETGRMTGKVETGCYDFGNGHMGIWAERTSVEAAPLYESKDRLEKQFGKDRIDWMLGRGRNLMLFPNVLLMDNPSTQIRTIRPLGPDRMEVTVRCIAPVGESRAARAARLRKFEDFYLTSGMATSDDLAALEDSFEGSQGRLARWNEFSRGQVFTIDGPDDYAKAIGCEAVTSSNCWDHETLFHGFYREWRRRMAGRNSRIRR